ncbi:hypothetical protein AB0F03_35425 [Streptomyces sp. NPDC028722]|uniref:hypothetical protein n=1 Tax=unclassified Streptomyces TaxID=2593676 RepID=UPI0033C5596A
MTIRLAGEPVEESLFAMRLSYSGKAVHRIFASCGQEAPRPPKDTETPWVIAAGSR